jgi:phosphatidylglycerophosphatase A
MHGGFSWISAGLGVAAVATILGTIALIDVEKRGVPADHDSRAVVIDEVAGAALGVVPLALAMPLVSAEILPMVLLAGFVFRVLDIAKPWPISAVDTKWHHPFAVIADDLLAGVGTALFMLLVLLATA